MGRPTNETMAQCFLITQNVYFILIEKVLVDLSIPGFTVYYSCVCMGGHTCKITESGNAECFFTFMHDTTESLFSSAFISSIVLYAIKTPGDIIF